MIPTWNSAKSLGLCLDALALSSFNRHASHRLRVIVCDDGSTDSTQADLRARGHDLNLVVIRQDNCGQSFALNAAIARAEADVVVFCDSDMLLGCGALDEIAARHQRWPDVLCVGFRTDIAPAAIPSDQAGLADLIHTEALSGDNRVRFDQPTLVPNMMNVTRWLTALDGGGHLLDCSGMHWPRHRFLFGCLFSVGRELIGAANGMPEIVPRWGYQDTLMAAKLEALGAFVLPVTTAWGWHVEHQIRHADQWFQYRRNALAYAEIMAQDLEQVSWRAPVGAAAPGQVWSMERATAVVHLERTVAKTPELLHALGLWEECLTALGPAPATVRENLIADECRFRLGQVEELSEVPATSSIWYALALLRVGRLAQAREAFRRIADGIDPVADYATSASPPELLHLAASLSANGMPEAARLHQDVAALLDPAFDALPVTGAALKATEQ